MKSSSTISIELFRKPDDFLNTKVSPSFPIRANRLFNNNDVQNIKVYKNVSKISLWMVNAPQICFKLCTVQVSQSTKAMSYLILIYVSFYLHFWKFPG